jgi:arylsulfatase A-like enzyme
MIRTRWIQALTVSLLLWACHDPTEPRRLESTVATVDAPTARSNVILVSVDTLRRDRLGCYGYTAPTSPAVDRFSGDAVLFDLAIAQAPSTLASHASLLTSLLPSHHGASWGASRPLPDEVTTLAEVLRAAGYRTAAFTGGGQLDPVYGIGQGFDTYRLPEQADTLENAVLAATDWMVEDRSQPFFLFLHTYEVHHPYTPDPDLLELFDSDYSGRLPNQISSKLVQRINSGELELEPGDLAHIVACYDAEVRSADRGFSALLSLLRSEQLYDETILVFTSDHGEEFGEHGAVGWHSHTLYDELLRVPLIIKFADRWSAGHEVSTQVRLIDVAPTILGALGIRADVGFHGVDLRGLTEHAGHPGLPAVSERDSDYGFDHASLRTPKFKLYPTALFGRSTLRGESLLRRATTRIRSTFRPYRVLDLVADPDELVDASRTHAKTRRRLRADIESELAARPHLQAPEIVIGADTHDQLRALGYVE